ncbi:hypothetical protein L2E82_39506 [Cichorium intybus]|uniref:Uncharacterized protein n=1 Tax=Cichorium intybus TaxID=13427 RepID=A0ACB9AJD3_CICIN|nr:hypothetical protein L2E82_39506 [Cichorium intybus]
MKAKKPVWNRPSNGVVEVVSPVVGAAWPALGDSTKASLKSSSSESLKALSDGPFPPALHYRPHYCLVGATWCGGEVEFTLLAVEYLCGEDEFPLPVTYIVTLKSYRALICQNRRVKNGMVSQPPPNQEDSVTETPHNTSFKSTEQPSPKDHTHKDSQKGGYGSQLHTGNDHNHHRAGVHSKEAMVGSIITTMEASAIMTMMPVQVKPFGNNMMYPDPTSPVIYVPFAPPESLRAMPFVTLLAPSMYFAVPDPQLHAKILSEIEYYFSNENLVKYTYLRKTMDEQGWVFASLIANFKKVSYLTDNVQLILDAMRTSTVVEVQEE